jgi:hypothetical protein
MADPALNIPAGDGQLSELESRILEFERQWWQYAGAKESSIRELFQLPPSRYYEILNNLIDREEALAAAPMLVKRLRRMREARLAERSRAR